jgi:hypothetical protein
MGGCLPKPLKLKDLKIFPERDVFGTSYWVQVVNAISEQEQYVKSLRQRMEQQKEDGIYSGTVSGFLDSAEKRLVELRQALKDIDEGG